MQSDQQPALCFHPVPGSPASFLCLTDQSCVWELVQLVACQGTLTCLRIWVVLKAPDWVFWIQESLYLQAGDRPVESQLCGISLCLLQCYVVTGRDLTDKDKGHNLETAWRKVFFSLPKCCVQWCNGFSGSRHCKLHLLALSARESVRFLILRHFVRPLCHRTCAITQQRYFLLAKLTLWQPPVCPAWVCLKSISSGVIRSSYWVGRIYTLSCLHFSHVFVAEVQSFLFL